MNQQELTALMASITGGLHTANSDEEKELTGLQESLAAILLRQPTETITNQAFTFQNSDLFFPQNIGDTRLEKIQDIVAQTIEKGTDTDLRMFMRDVPVRTTQITGSVPSFAAGARPVATVGPIRHIDGRNIFIDFFRIEKLIALYFKGQSLPAILFKARFTAPRILLPIGLKVELTNKYTVIPHSVWINARLLSPDAPPDYYCGLRVKGGTIQLKEAPKFEGNKLVIAATNEVSVALKLEQKNDMAADATSPYGKDARAATYHLPESVALRFTSTTKTINSVAPANWKVYGQAAGFTYTNNQNLVYNPFLSRLAIPLTCDAPTFTVADCQSSFMQLTGNAPIKNSWWALPTARLDVANPLEADGNGTLIVECGPGLGAQWLAVENNPVALVHPFIIGEPGRIGITDLESNGSGAFQQFNLWKDEVNSFGTSIELYLLKKAPFIFNTLSKGDEVVMTQTNAKFQIDRPVKVNGEAVAVQSKNSVLVLAAGKLKHTVSLYDDNILWDNKLPADKIPLIQPVALALHNALFTVTPPNGALLFGECDAAFKNIHRGTLFLTFGLFSYLPTLPDPYTANLGVLLQQFQRDSNQRNNRKKNSIVWLWLVAKVQWQVEEEKDAVGVSFHFAPLQQPVEVGKKVRQNKSTNTQVRDEDFPLQSVIEGTAGVAITGQADAAMQASATAPNEASFRELSEKVRLLSRLSTDMFTLLDVSSKANQMGVSFSVNGQQVRGTSNFAVVNNAAGTAATLFPLQVQGMDVVTEGQNAKAFALPQIAWEPVYNFTKPAITTPTPSKVDPAPTVDPPYGWNYYPNDGMATRISNLSKKQVALSPIPLSKYLVQMYQSKNDGQTFAVFNLPFGMIALAFLNSADNQTVKPDIQSIQPVFNNYINGGIQLELTAGSSKMPGDDHLFEGFTVQLPVVLNTDGTTANATTLGSSVTTIFNNEFFKANKWATENRAAAPVKRIGLSGYGASMFSNWANKDAAFAQTSQALFNVAVGRTGHEVIQVKSIIYPWGIKVVRTITIFRLSNGYVGRVDSGWKAESDGKFDFRFKVQAFPVGDPDPEPNTVKTADMPSPYTIHPGMIHGLYNIRNIREIETTFSPITTAFDISYRYDAGGTIVEVQDGIAQELLQGLTFDADIKIENVTEGGVKSEAAADLEANLSFVPSKGVLGFVQLAPRGKPISNQAFVELLQSQNDSIGGPINCVIKVAGTAQRMKLDRFDVNNSIDKSSKPIFVGATRGSVMLPKDGSWSMVMHTRTNGDVSPIPESYSVPLIREGLLDFVTVVNKTDIKTKLLRLAHPQEIVRDAVKDTINFGLLQNLPTQKVLFLTPAFSTTQQFLLSKTPPLLADSYRLLNTKGIFPNIGQAENADFGAAIQLLKGGADAVSGIEAFADSTLTDAGKKAYQLLEMKAKEEGQKLLDQGYKLIKDKASDLANEAFKFDLPSFEYPLICLDKVLKIAIEYKADSKANGNNYKGKFDFTIDSFAATAAKTWKSRMHNMAIVVDLGTMKRLLTVKGNFNAQKGKETDLGGQDAADNTAFTLPTPELEFSDDLKPVIQILEILSALSTGDYAGALKKGLKVAMSNSANIWEYKFEASKEIGLIRFPPGVAYEAPQTPLKLEASMSLGFYFNAALKVTTDPKQLLPTAGAFFQFHGGLQVMCLTVGGASVYAVGQVDLKLAADTSPKISLTMKFGFGVQIGVGLPVIGSVSVLFMAGVEIYADSTGRVAVSAFLLFRGHAELLGGLVGVTITIEAKGTIDKAPAPAPTNCIAKVTFALDISIFLVIDISFSESWEETRQIA